MFYLGVNTLLIAFSFLLNHQFILAVFLLFNLLVGLWASRGVKSLEEYSIGKKDFSTGALTATIVSTWIGGSFMTSYLANIYTNGWYFILPFIGDSFALLITGLWLVPRMGEFLNNLSVADALGKLYGRAVQLITAICGVLVSIGAVAVQFKVSAQVLAIVFGFDELYATVAAAAIVITYSALGGVRSIVLTDMVQFFTFSAFIPLLVLVIWNGLENPTAALQVVKTSTQFNFQAFLGSPKRSLGGLFLMIFYLVPAFVPTIFQRVSMASHVGQAKRSFLYSFVLCLVISLFTVAIGVLLFAQNSHLDPNKLLNYVIDTYNYPGLKGLILIGVMAIIMSTADSHLNAAAVLCAHDLGLKFKNETLAARYFSFILGILALILALDKTSFLALALLAWSFYMPIVSVPLLMAIFGFRSTPRAVLIGMAAGGIAVVLWDHYLADIGLDGIVPGMVANLAFLLGSHYSLREQGGWTGIKDPAPLIAARQSRQDAWRHLMNNLNSTKIYEYLQKNLPTREIVYVLFGIYVMGATYALFFTIPQEAVLRYKALYDFITYSVMFTTAIFITYPIWPLTLKATKWFITFAWSIGIGYILFVVGAMLVMMSGFHQIQVMVFLFNLVMAALLLDWPLVICLASLCTLVGYLVFNTYYGSIYLTSVVDSSQFKLFYGTLLFSSLLMALFRFKQSKSRLEDKINYLITTYAATRDELTQVLDYREQLLKELNPDEIALVDHTTAAYMRQVIYRLTDYLRLEVVGIKLEELLAEVKYILLLKDFTTPPQLIIKKDTQEEFIYADREKIKQLLVNSIVYIHDHNLPKEPITIALEDAMLGHRVDQMQGYIRKLKALKITITTEKELPPREELYRLDQTTLISQVFAGKEKALVENARIIEAHYGYGALDKEDTHVYVLPIHLREVRGKVMELLREPAAADPDQTKHPIAIQLEQELLTRIKSMKDIHIEVIWLST
jgi:Na+/proline symporter